MLAICSSSFFTPVAVEDLDSGYWWYENEEAGLGYRFEVAILAALEKICVNPQHYSYSQKGYCRILVPGFPYIITFEVSEADEMVYVDSIYHTSRDIEGRYRKRDE